MEGGTGNRGWKLLGTVAALAVVWVVPPVGWGVLVGVAAVLGGLLLWRQQLVLALGAAWMSLLASGVVMLLHQLGGGAIAAPAGEILAGWALRGAGSAALLVAVCSTLWQQAVRGLASPGGWRLWLAHLWHQVELLRREVRKMGQAVALRGRPRGWRARGRAGQAFLLRLFWRGHRLAQGLELRMDPPPSLAPLKEPPSARPPVVSLCQVDIFTPQGQPILRRLTFSLNEGERLAILGANGSGKTSLLLAIAGFLPHTGHLALEGMRLSPTSVRRVRRCLSMVFANPEDQLLLPGVAEDLLFGLPQDHRPVPLAYEAEQTLQALGLGNMGERLVATLSRGEQTLVALAGAVLRRPRLLLLDEISASLDPPSKERVLALLATLPCAVVIATHDVPFARALAPQFLWLEGGKASPPSPHWDCLPKGWGSP
ncbi:MAG: energy-coupling factor ABC transporter ATP-binding protein [Thermoanaerobaculum sp.]|nr:energy-coupling factor ABC transporter ATP-binding protein [Thermoanaerobaculum sp.]MDW7967083.1 ABC transporter ATP-binding protein [Thermoanaerobaculum sp.]